MADFNAYSLYICHSGMRAMGGGGFVEAPTHAGLMSHDRAPSTPICVLIDEIGEWLG